MTKLEKFMPPKRGCSFTPTIAIPFLFVAGEDVHLIDENGDAISICSAASASMRSATATR